MKTIYNVYVPIESQEQADRMLALCKEYNFPYWDDEDAFELSVSENWFEYYKEDKEFIITCGNTVGETEFGKTKVTEQEFINLLKEMKEEPKQETLEEVAEKESEKRYPVLTHKNPDYSPYIESKKTFKHGVNFGAKWQQQQNKN